MSVQTLRPRKGWTQEQPALVSGLGVRTLRRIERGETASAESLEAPAAAFDVDFLDLEEPDMTDTTLASAPAAAFDADLLLAFDQVRRKRRFLVGLLASVWAVWPALAWGVALFVGWLRVAGFSPWGPAWEWREVEKRLGRPL